ncbi:putative porin [Arenibacter sp. BSSL-BM3]|uniref:Porin n=1 Tax=Arenibacter arenosicollis TaxID=2762274 RepID=A0ABR7QTT9_9FLAO|nr:putative porin [Arenibacter arenosicollis]MBC8770619.1 putative porin [Arenibacter arenosicollis]
MRYLLTLLIVFFSQAVSAQEDSIPSSRKEGAPSMNRNIRNLPPKKNGEGQGQEITIKDYKIISYERDTTFLDTTISIQKEYINNFLRRDDFELMPFANVGQPYNKLGVNFDIKDTYPSLGASAKHYNYMEAREVNYYNVATPMSDLMFKTTFERGQLLDALLAFNTSRQLNFSIAYKGFRSLGKYQYSEAESGNFKMTANYESKNQRYNLRTHMAAQNSTWEENGGLSNKELQFESGDPDFKDRSRLDVLFSNATNRLLGKRYYLDHQYILFGKKMDSARTRTTSLALGHEFSYETKYYQFKQSAQNDYFGDGYASSIGDKASLKTTYNNVYAQFSNRTLGVLTGHINHYQYNYYFNSVLQTPTQLIQSQLSGDEISAGAKYVKKIGGFQLNGSAQANISGDLSGNLLDAFASYDINKKNTLKFSIHSSSRMPNFNFLLYQSDYTNYNWQHTEDFKKLNNNGFQFDLESSLFGNLMAKYTSLDNYTYFASDPSETVVEGGEQAFIKPFQESGTINIIKVKYGKEFKWKGFALDNTVMYQNVSQPNEVLNVPEVVTRNTLYYSNFVFKKAMYLQTGVTLKYFTSYNADAYNPVLGEFYSQGQEELGGFPMLDFFINARVQQTRIFLKAEHFNSSFSGSNFYAAPNYPYRDFVIRFGLVWNFFS